MGTWPYLSMPCWCTLPTNTKNNAPNFPNRLLADQQFLILRYAFIILNLYNSGSTLPHNLEGYILHLDVLHLNQLVQGASRVSVSPTFFGWRRIGAPDHVLQRIDGLAHGGNVLRWCQTGWVLKKIAVPGHLSCRLGGNIWKTCVQMQCLPQCVQIGYDGIQIDASKMFKFFCCKSIVTDLQSLSKHPL